MAIIFEDLFFVESSGVLGAAGGDLHLAAMQGSDVVVTSGNALRPDLDNQAVLGSVDKRWNKLNAASGELSYIELKNGRGRALYVKQTPTRGVDTAALFESDGLNDGDVIQIVKGGAGDGRGLVILKDNNSSGPALEVFQQGIGDSAIKAASNGILTPSIHGINNGGGEAIRGEGGNLNNGIIYLLESKNPLYASTMFLARCTRSNNPAFTMMRLQSSAGLDNEFAIFGDGSVVADGSLNSPADFAEMFETHNPSGLPFGIAVQFRPGTNKVVPASQAEQVIGITSARPGIIGDGEEFKWSKKYLQNDFGGYIRDEDGNRILNPEFDPNQKYIPRRQRQNWIPVALLGKVWTRCTDLDVTIGDRVTINNAGRVRKATQLEISNGVRNWYVINVGETRQNFVPVRVLYNS